MEALFTSDDSELELCRLFLLLLLLSSEPLSLSLQQNFFQIHVCIIITKCTY